MKQQKELYSQNKLADMLGISRGTFSKWLKDNSVSPEQLNGQRKLYSKTVIEQYKKMREVRENNTSSRLTTVELLQNDLDEKQKEMDYLRQQLKEKDKVIADKDEVIKDSNNKLYELGNKVAKLADQAQQLNLADKKQPKLEENIDRKETVASVDETVEQKKTEKKKGFWSKWFGKD